MNSVFETVKEAIVSTSPIAVDTSTIKEDSWLVEFGFDSVNSLELVMTLEEKFDLEIEDEDVSTIQTVNDIVLMIDAYQAHQGSGQ